jgi:hypothetical protein
VGDNAIVDRSDDAHPREDPVDVTVLLAAAVAVLILAAGYLLFNEVPSFGRSAGDRRANRRR